MPRKTKDALTNTRIRKAKIKDKQYKLFDGQGLIVLIHPNGSKYFRWRYYIEGREKLLSLGVYPVISLSTAREERLIAEQLLKQGYDPVEHYRKERAKIKARIAEEKRIRENPFRKIAEDWISQQPWSVKHIMDVKSSLRIYAYPMFGEEPIAEISKETVRSLLLGIHAQGKTNTAHRVQQRLSRVFKFAMDRDLCDRNYASELESLVPAAKSENMKHIPREELADYLRRLDANEINIHRVTWIAIKIMINTFVRTGELRFAEWSEFDLDEALWRIPGEHTKLRREHLVPLSSQVISLLHELKNFSGHCRFAFPGQQNQDRPLRDHALIEGGIYRMGYKGKAHIHGFRSLADTILNESNQWNPDAIERQLGHMERNPVRAAYNRARYLDERKRMMQWWSDYLDALKVSANDRQSKVQMWEGGNVY